MIQPVQQWSGRVDASSRTETLEPQHISQDAGAYNGIKRKLGSAHQMRFGAYGLYGMKRPYEKKEKTALLDNKAAGLSAGN